MPLKACIIPVTAFAQNCSLIWCDETMKGAFVDPGGEAERLLAAAEENGVEIEKILVTHAHLDHAGAVADLAEKLGVPIEGPHRDDQFLIESLPQQCEMYGFPPSRSFEPSRWLDGGDEVSVGKLTLTVRHCPGHTPGHVVFYEKETGLAFVGDVLFRGSIGRTDFPRGNHADLLNSIQQQLWPLGSETVFVPGHGDTSTFGEERQSNPFVSDRALAG
ncbi:MBL fold metallo-hydrolase [Aestuariispira insulae]|uniref:Glyoxylase-like metal-dependent hydrolase (Beta-lactamase superfamily II) n=1 Tax=Aestuariispira insulae TaxID=1461337 RepID=A0A3D9HR82_9PROT|nr:MBL fold metallo-hydrolase [Aestuariispira insulae]RED51988.1 glyoxylase-like metal-dependent hydrolase (beta-lactamase superfamily II) [Aestuariispira insulae]